MEDRAGDELREEPQEERGAAGSRDSGSPEPAGGPVDRPVGTSDARSQTSVKPDEPIGDESPTLSTGEGG